MIDRGSQDGIGSILIAGHTTTVISKILNSSMFLRSDNVVLISDRLHVNTTCIDYSNATNWTPIIFHISQLYFQLCTTKDTAAVLLYIPVHAGIYI